MKGDEVLVMTSLVIIFAVFLRRRRSFIQQMRLMSLQMRKMRRNLLILSMQQRNNIQCHNWDKRKTMWVYPRPQFWFKDQPKKWRIQWGRWDCKSKEMTVGIVYHVEFLKLNQEAIVWKIISGAPNDNFRKNICSEDNLRSRISEHLL